MKHVQMYVINTQFKQHRIKKTNYKPVKQMVGKRAYFDLYNFNPSFSYSNKWLVRNHIRTPYLFEFRTQIFQLNTKPTLTNKTLVKR